MSSSYKKRCLLLLCVCTCAQLVVAVALKEHSSNNCKAHSSLQQQLSTFMSTFTTEETTSTRKVYEQDGEEAREIAKVIPYFPFKGIPRFYDIGGFLSKPGKVIRVVYCQCVRLYV